LKDFFPHSSGQHIVLPAIKKSMYEHPRTEANELPQEMKLLISLEIIAMLAERLPSSNHTYTNLNFSVKTFGILVDLSNF